MSEANNHLSTDNNLEDTTLEQNSSSESSATTTNHPQKEIDWHKLAHKLREHNRKLLKKVFQLEQDMVESNQALTEQQKISQSHNLYVAQQAETINQYQEEIAALQQKIIDYERDNNHQQSSFESLSNQLEASQNQVTQLEQTCTKLQVENKAQAQEILDKNRQIQELNTRFYRQQQYFLEHKIISSPQNNSQPIKAWSAKSSEPNPLTATAFSLDINTSKANDWPAPAIANNQAKIKSLAAVKLPQFSHQAEGT